MKRISVLVPLVAILALIAGCGGGSSSGTGAADVTSLSSVPDDVLNPQAYDLTTQSASTSISKGLNKAQAVGGFSRAGCETDTMKKNIIRNAILPRMILCNIKAFETAAGGAAAGNGVFNYWKMNKPSDEQGPGGVDEFAPRVAIKLDGKALTFVMCNGSTKSMELYISTAGGVYNGHVVDKWGEGFEGKLEFSADGLPPNDFTSAQFTQSFVEASTYFSGYGSSTLLAVPTSNIVYGFNSGTMPGAGGTFAGATYAKFNATQGTAKYRMDEGSFPAQTVEEAYGYCVSSGYCEAGDAASWIAPDSWLVSNCGLTGLALTSKLCFGNGDCPVAADENGQCDIASGDIYTESFTVNNANPLSLVFAVAADSIYSSDVGLAAMPSSATAPTIAFTSASADVDCSTSGSWTELAFVTKPDVATCRAMEEELNNWQSGEICANQEAQDKAGEGAQ